MNTMQLNKKVRNARRVSDLTAEEWCWCYDSKTPLSEQLFNYIHEHFCMCCGYRDCEGGCDTDYNYPYYN